MAVATAADGKNGLVNTVPQPDYQRVGPLGGCVVRACPGGRVAHLGGRFERLFWPIGHYIPHVHEIL